MANAVAMRQRRTRAPVLRACHDHRGDMINDRVSCDYTMHVSEARCFKQRTDLLFNRFGRSLSVPMRESRLALGGHSRTTKGDG